MSSDLHWMIVRNNHAHLHKKRNVNVPFSSESGNLRNINSRRFNGFVTRRPLVITPLPKERGVVLKYKSTKPSMSQKTFKHTIKGNSRRTLGGVKKFFRHNNYPGHLIMPALRRTSAINRSQKDLPHVPKKKGSKRKRKSRKSTKKGSSKKPAVKKTTPGTAPVKKTTTPTKTASPVKKAE